MKTIIAIISSCLMVGLVNANENYKLYLKEQCYIHSMAKEYSHGINDGTNAERCFLIGTAQAKYETNFGKLGAGKTHNNIYGFRANGFMYFNNKWESIDWYVNRYYTYDRFKTISQIIKGGCYTSPIDGIYKCFPGFTFDEEHKENYYNFTKEYFNKNKDE